MLNACAELLLDKEKIGREEFEALFENRAALADEASAYIGE